ncbi:hypothetical protein V5O48_005643 [Marasmius crinis-equi]|uniref:cAMP-independent regulatory protein pac2 n=1 Tax=Marasmius crinis-equi TaxID=585013 RepID=A0ABR3FM56_9AGAR
MLHMQQPTCTNVRIRSTTDAHKIFYAVQRGALRMITRRLDADERLALTSGCVYAWEERGPHTEITGLGIERFTEGRRWSPSRVRDVGHHLVTVADDALTSFLKEFLFYYEKYSPDPGQSSNNSGEKQHPPRDWDPLVKQTYSVWVETEKGKRKWHLTAYFTQATVDQLGTVDDIQDVGSLSVPEGHFKSTRVKKGSSKMEDSTPIPSAVEPPKNVHPSLPGRTFVPFPAPPSPSTRSNPVSTQPIHMFQPYPNSYNHYTPSAQQRASSQPPSSVRYPQLTPAASTVPSNYTAPVNQTPEPQEQGSLRLTIPPTPSTAYHPPQPYSAGPISPEQHQNHTLTTPVYSSTQSPVQASPHSPQQPPWYHNYHHKPSHDLYESTQPHPLRQCHSGSPEAAEAPAPAPPYTLTPQQPYMPLSYHAPAPIRPISSEALSTSPYPHAADVASTPVHDPSAQYSSPHVSQIPLPHLSYPPIQHAQHTDEYSRPSTGHFREHAIPSYPEMHSTSPASSASGSAGSAYSMVDANADPTSHLGLEDRSSPERDPEHGLNRGLAPLGVLKRPHPYRRHPGDDKTLRLLARRNAGTELET